MITNIILKRHMYKSVVGSRTNAYIDQHKKCTMKKVYSYEAYMNEKHANHVPTLYKLNTQCVMRTNISES